MKIRRLDFPLAKAAYLLYYTTASGEGGDKRKFWHDIMGFQSAAVLREVLLSEMSTDRLQPTGHNVYGDLYEAVVLVAGPSGKSRQVRTGWIVLAGEEVARFVTAYPA